MRIHRNPLIWAAVATCGIATALPIALAQKPEAPAEPEKSEPGAAAENPAADQQAWLGVAVDELHPEAGVQLGVPEGVGLSVHAVVPNSPADEAGIEERDLLTQLDDQILVSPKQLQVLVRAKKPGDSVNLTFLRKGEELKAEVALGGRDPEPLVTDSAQPDNRRPQRVDDLLGRANQGRNRGNVDLERLFDLFGGGANGRDLEKEMNEMAERVRRQFEDQMQQLQNGMRMNFDLQPGGGAQSTSVINVNDGDHAITLECNNGEKKLHVEDAAGKVIYDGPFNTEADRAKLPADVLAKVDGIEIKVDGGGGVHVEGRAESGGSASKVVAVEDKMAAMKCGENTITLKGKPGEMRIEIKGKDGKMVYEGPYNTDADRQNVPENCRDNAAALEASFGAAKKDAAAIEQQQAEGQKLPDID